MRKDYHVKVRTIDLETQEEIGATRNINYSTTRGREYLDRVIFSCLNTGKGVTIELDRVEPTPL